MPEREPWQREDVDSCLAAVPEPGCSTLDELRRAILAVIPDAEQCLSYGRPASRSRPTWWTGWWRRLCAEPASISS